MKTISLASLCLVLISLLSCGSLIQEVNPDNLPKSTSKLVVHCFISPQDEILAAYVDQSDNGTLYPVHQLEEGIVLLSDGTDTAQLVPIYRYSTAITNAYYINGANALPIVAGRTYTLTVSVANFPTVTARCTVPKQVNPTEIRIDSVIKTQSDVPQTIYSGRLVWHDPINQTNFYEVSGRSIETFTYSEAQPTNGSVLTSSNDLLFDSATLLTDLNRNGEKLISAKGVRTLYHQSNARNQSLLFNFKLSNVDENYYRYHDAVARQRNADENPFAEPVLIPSNIQNGIGCFGAFNQASLTVRVR